MNPKLGTLEDPDEARPVHMKGKKETVSGKCDSETILSVET